MAMRVVPLLRRSDLFSRRLLSTFTGNDGIIELDLSSSSPSPSSPEEASALKKLDDVVQRLMVQKATPDWLPFRPGASFWVPPRTHRRRNNLADLLAGLAENLPDHDADLHFATASGEAKEDEELSSDEDDRVGEVEMVVTDEDEDDSSENNER